MASSGNSSTINTVPSSEAELASILDVMGAESECDTNDLEAILEEEGFEDDCLGIAEDDNRDLEIMPMPGKPVIAGGFHGVWGLDNLDHNMPQGDLCGVYGFRNHVKRGSSFFRGMWKTDDGEVTGYLVGKGINGRLHGIWYWPEKCVGGRIKGTYTPLVTDATKDSEMSFEGIWYRGGRQIGYMEGNWSPVEEIVTSKIFEGEWSRGGETPSDGIIKGVHGRIELEDGTSVPFFRGRWESNDGAYGRLAGLGLDGSFCGIWKGEFGFSRGYLEGTYKDKEFSGTWGHFGQEPSGRLWGTYGMGLNTPIPQEENQCIAAS